MRENKFILYRCKPQRLQLTLAGTGVSSVSEGVKEVSLTNSSVSLGGVSVDLGGTDATPAFDLSDATSYPTSSLTY